MSPDQCWARTHDRRNCHFKYIPTEIACSYTVLPVLRSPPSAAFHLVNQRRRLARGLKNFSDPTPSIHQRLKLPVLSLGRFSPTDVSGIETSFVAEVCSDIEGRGVAVAFTPDSFCRWVEDFAMLEAVRVYAEHSLPLDDVSLPTNKRSAIARWPAFFASSSAQIP